MQEPIDLSNTNIDVSKVCVRIAPCTSVLKYRDDYLREDSFIQDFQVMVYPKNKMMIRIFLYRVSWVAKKKDLISIGKKKDASPFDASFKLTGKSTVLIASQDTQYVTELVPIFNDNLQILGTQLILNAGTDNLNQ